MKKVIAIVLAVALCFALFACGDEPDIGSTTTTESNNTSTTVDPYASARKDGVINKPVTKTISSMCKENADTGEIEVGVKQDRTITFKGTIKIGNTAASTGAFASVGAPFNAGIEAYINKVNFNGGIGGDYASGKQGYYIEFIHYDDGFDTNSAETYTKKLVEKDKVFALVGHFGSPTVSATIDYIKEQGVVACYMASGVAELFNTDADTVQSGSTIFPVHPIYSTEGRIIVGRIIEQHPEAKKIGIIYTPDESGQGVMEGARAQIEALGSNYEYVIAETTSDTTDFSSAVSKIADCDAVIIATIKKPAIEILSTMITKKVYKPVFMSYSLASSDILMSISNQYNALNYHQKFPIYANSWFDYDDEKSRTDFVNDINSYNGGTQYKSDSYAMAGWIAANVFCEGVERIIESGKEINNLTYVEAMESAEIEIKMTSGATLNYSDGYRLGTTTMALLESSYTCISFEVADGMKDFYDFIKTGNVDDI